MVKVRRNYDEIGTLTGVAKSLHVPKSTLDSAIKANLVRTSQLACGQRVIDVASARAWLDSPRTRGPKVGRKASSPAR